MKTLKSLTFILFVLGVLSGDILSQTATTSNEPVIKRSLRHSFPQFSIEPYGGVIFPLPRILNQNFKPGGNVNLDIGYRVNREVGFYAKAGYYVMSSKLSGAPIGNYLEISGGPRYYFTKLNLKSELYLKAELERIILLKKVMLIQVT